VEAEAGITVAHRLARERRPVDQQIHA
jgi:hypothetical protein